MDIIGTSIVSDVVVGIGVSLLCHLLPTNTKKCVSAEKYIVDAHSVSNCSSRTIFNDNAVPFLSIATCF